MKFSEAGGNGKFSETGEESFRRESIFLDHARGELKIAPQNNFENDIDLKVTPE